MRTLLALCVAGLIAPAISAETGITGTWATAKKAQPQMIMDLTASGTTLTGKIRAGEGGEPVVMAIVDGKVVGTRVTFKTTVANPDGPYTMMFSGRRVGNTITFKCDVEVNPPGEKVALGPACVQKVTVTRASR
jgi:hypothetical protein